MTARTLVLLGLAIAAIGGLMMLGLPLGRLPGDIVIQRERGTFYFPIVTCIVLSVLLTVVLSLFRR
jgi:hypothetical protein